MCGLVGIFHNTPKPIPTHQLNTMIRLLAHRGPDDQHWCAINTHTNAVSNPESPNGLANLLLGFARLAIQDLSQSARQPMTNAAQDLWLVFNGEIYNAPELKSHLGNRHRQFISHADTEVILALYEELGEASFVKLNGMFAFALYDQRKQQLYLVRDRMGIKPLYYSQIDDTFIFASEIKPLLSLPQAQRGLCTEAVLEYFTFQFCLNEKTIFQDIHLVPPGQYVVLDFHQQKPSFCSRTYWDLQFHPQPSINLNDYAHQLADTLGTVIQRQIRSDVPVGCFLSGGMDTGSICALARQWLPKLPTFTCGFDIDARAGYEQLTDERAHAQALATLLGAVHHELTVNATHLAALTKSVTLQLEDPRVGISYQIYALAAFVKRFVTVVLSGTGGDELFAGYHWRYSQLQSVADSENSDWHYYQIWNRLTNDNNRWHLFSDQIKQQSQHYHPWQAFQKAMQRCESHNRLERAWYFDIQGFLQSLLLVDDKLSMAHALETRVPLLDNDIISLALQMPTHFKYHHYETKIVLKKALKSILPEEVLTRRKQGFTPPDAYWMRHQSRPYLEKILLDDRTRDSHWFKSNAIQQILHEHFSAAVDHRFLIWGLLNFTYINNWIADGYPLIGEQSCQTASAVI